MRRVRRVTFMRKYLFLSVYLFPIFLFVLTVLLALIYKPPFVQHDTDEFIYLSGIIKGRNNGLFFGRIGFVYLYHYLYAFIALFVKISPLNGYHVLKFFTIVISGCLIVIWFICLKRFTRSFFIALVSCLLLYTNYTFLRYSGAVMTDIPALLLPVLSLFIFYFSIQKKSNLLLYISAVVFGLGFLIKEQSLFIFPWFLALIISSNKFKLKQIVIFTISVFLTVLICVVIELHLNKQIDLNSVMNYLKNNQISSSKISFNDKLIFFFRSFPPILIILFVGGLVIKYISIVKRRKIMQGLLLLFLLLLPFYPIIHSIPIYERRFYIPLWFMVTLFASFLLTYIKTLIDQFFPNTKKYSVFILFSLVILYIGNSAYHNYYSYIIPDNRRSEEFKVYAETTLENLPDNSVLLVGGKSWLAGDYLKHLLGTNWDVIYSGWGWKGVDQTKQKIIFDLQNRKPVFVDFTQAWESADLEDIMKNFKLIKFRKELYKVEMKEQ